MVLVGHSSCNTQRFFVRVQDSETPYWGKKLEWRTSQLGGLADPVSSRGSLQRTATVLPLRSNPDTCFLDVLSLLQVSVRSA